MFGCGQNDIIVSMTEIEQVRHELEVSETKFRRLFETAQDGILLIDPVTNNIIDANPFLLKLIGYTKEEILGKKLWEIGAFKDVNESKEAFDVLKAKNYIRYEDMPLQSKDGRVVEVEFVSNRYPIDGLEMIQCNIRDITSRKKIERIAATYLAEIENTNKLLAERQASMIDIGNTMNVSDRDKATKIVEIYVEGIAALKKLSDDWKAKMAE